MIDLSRTYTGVILPDHTHITDDVLGVTLCSYEAAGGTPTDLVRADCRLCMEKHREHSVLAALVVNQRLAVAAYSTARPGLTGGNGEAPGRLQVGRGSHRTLRRIATARNLVRASPRTACHMPDTPR